MINKKRMPRILALCLLALVVTTIVGISIAAWSHPTHKGNPKVLKEDDRLIVNEWGTFTSISVKDDIAIEWQVMNGSSDLQKFSNTIQNEDAGLSHDHEVQLTA